MEKISRKQTYNWNHDFPKLALESGFSFNTHRPRVYIDWNRIRLLDLNKVIHDRDFSAVDEHVYEVLDCNLESEFDVRILDVGVVKLFRLSQLAVEFLLYCKQYLDRVVLTLREDLNMHMKENDKLKKELYHKEGEIRKMRKRSRGGGGKTTLAATTDNIAAMLLKTLTQGGHPKQNEYSKCAFCDKVFLNDIYLNSHMTRRHPDQIPEHDHQTTYHQESPKDLQRNDTDTLYLEIKDLKERLNTAETRLKNKDAEDIVTKDDATKGKFEEWKREEQGTYLGEIENLRKQLVESVNLMRANSENGARGDGDVAQLRNDLKTQDDEIKILKKQLDDKMVQIEKSELSSQLEAQERVWRSRVLSMEQQHKQKLDELMSKVDLLSEEIKTAKNAGEVERSKAKVLEEKLEEKLTEMGQMEQRMKIITPKPLKAMDSVETLPAYDDIEEKRPSSSNQSNREKRARLMRSKSMVVNNYRNRPKQKSSDSESSAEIVVKRTKKVSPEVVQALAEARRRFREKGATFDKESDVVVKQADPPAKPKLVRQSTFTIEPEPEVEEKKVEDIPPERPKTAMAANRRMITKDAVSSDSDSESESDSEGSSEEIEEEKKEEVHANDITGETRPDAGFHQPSADDGSVRAELRTLLNDRLQDLGVDPQCRGLPTPDYRKAAAVLKREQTTILKKDQSYKKIRESILQYLDKRTGKVPTPKKNVHKEPSLAEVSQTDKSTRSHNRSLTSLLSNVKSRALAMIRTTTPRTKKLSEQKMLEMSLTKRAAAILKTPPSSAANSPRSSRSKMSTSRSSLRSSQKSLPSTQRQKPPLIKQRPSKSMSVLSNLKESAENLLKKKGADDSEDSSEDSSNIDERMHRNNAKKFDSRSKSLENLINSPIRVPESNLRIINTDSKVISTGAVEVHEDLGSRETLDSHPRTPTHSSSMYRNATTSDSESESSAETKEAQLRMLRFKKSLSEENVRAARNPDSPASKGVLKNYPSNGSLAKKKVLFDLEATQTKSVSETGSYAEGSKSDDTSVVPVALPRSVLPSRDTWEISSIEDVVEQPSKPMNLSSPERSNRVVDISKRIEQQLSGRSIKPPTGSVDLLFQTKHLAPTVPVRSGSTTSLGSSLLDGSGISPAKNMRNRLLTAPGNAPKKPLDDLELSDWSIEDLLNDKT